MQHTPSHADQQQDQALDTQPIQHHSAAQQASRICSHGNNDSWVITHKAKSLLSKFFFTVLVHFFVCGMYSVIQNMSIFHNSEYQICIAESSLEGGGVFYTPSLVFAQTNSFTGYTWPTKKLK